MDKKSRELVMAKLYFKNKDYKMAEKSFNEYLSMNPEDVAALKLLAQVYEQNKRFDKAFEMYERCYLAEPDRTGVLLDICRILLMNEIYLEHVDYRKWLNLAIKAFPSNPIVVNFKAFLSTLPPDEQASPQREIVTKSTPKLHGEDPLVKIFEKLSNMEKRLENIEVKMSNLTVAQNTSQPTIDTTPKPAAGFSFAPIATNPLSFQREATPEKNTAQPTIDTKPKPSGGFSFAPIVTTPLSFQKEATPEKKTESPFNLNTNLFAESMKKLNLPTESNGQSAFSFSMNTNLFAESMKKLNLPTESNGPSTFSFSTNQFGSASTQKNIPPQPWTTSSNSAFGFSKPVDENEDEDEGEVVQNEELAIENTCDMKPIEYKTGEEEDDILFEARCKLFRFKDKEYKERGIGTIKVLRNRSTGKGRLIMRRDAIGLVCLNCWNCIKVNRPRDTQVRWTGLDASDGEPEALLFLARFKTEDLADTFMTHLTALSDESSPNTSVCSPQSKPGKISSETDSGTEKPEIELVDPKLDQSLVDKARKLQLPDLFYHKLKNQDSCSGCNGCEKDE